MFKLVALCAVAISVACENPTETQAEAQPSSMPTQSEKTDLREDFFGADGFKHAKKYLKTKPAAPSAAPKPAAPSPPKSRSASINQITAAEIYRDILRSLNESFRVMNKRCKCYGPDVWLRSFPYESADAEVLLKDYRFLVTEYVYHVIQRAKYCGCAKTVENATERSEEAFVKKLPSSVLLPDKNDSYVMTKLDFYRSILALDKSLQKAIGKCCKRNTGDSEGTDPDISTCHIT